ncbi:MAG: carbohydrate binding family 9 domain-containing protein [Bacteroidetes bacterium]|nr:carbohydrate binding family 9 domain-containing protein [Bacteroidota bacterium]
MSVFSTFFKVSVLCTITTILPLRSSAQHLESGLNEPMKIQRIKSPVKLDGLSNESAWEGIKSLPIIMRAPNFGSEPSERTEILLSYDDDYLYAAGRFYDSETSKIQATSFKRDVWNYTTDNMIIVIDAFNDNENAVMFMTTPAGTRTDVNILNDAEGAPLKNVNPSWNTFWDVATVCNDDGWFTEMRIPFSSIRFEERDGQTVMGITAFRWIARKFEMDISTLIPEKFGFWGAFKPSQTQDVLFEDIKSHNPLYITPYLLGGLGQSNELNDTETAYKRTDKFVHEAGLDVKYGLTNNLTLDVTLNTDFAQVEADDQMINLTRYSLFFPEKRLFFQERSGNFDFSFEDMNRLFYSRRIGIHEGDQVRIYGGARVVGRAGPWDIGFLNMQTENFKALPSENFNVLRLRKQVINPYSYIGGMVTSRIGNKDSWNTTYGIDGIFRLFGDDYLTLKWAQSFKDNEKNQIVSLEPSKIYVNWNRRSNKGLGYNLSYSRSGDDFNPGIGYERRDNYTRFGDRVHYGWFPGEESKLHNYQVFFEGITFIRNMDGNIESSDIGLGWEFETRAGSSGSISSRQFKENVTELFSFSDDADVPTGSYTFYVIKSSFSTPKGSPYSITTTVDAGSFYDGRRFTITLKPFIAISKHLQLEGMYQVNRVEFPDRNQKFTGHIGQLKTSVFLNSKLSLIPIVQYNSAIDEIITNIRFRYNPQEGHDLYIVYDEGLNTYRQREIPVLPRTNNRTILVKYNYTFNIGL